MIGICALRRKLLSMCLLSVMVQQALARGFHAQAALLSASRPPFCLYIAMYMTPCAHQCEHVVMLQHGCSLGRRGSQVGSRESAFCYLMLLQLALASCHVHAVTICMLPSAYVVM